MKKNLLLKILVLLMAFLFWILQSLWRDHDTEILIPINFVNLPKDLIVMNEVNPEVTLQFQARGLDFVVFHLSEPYIEINAAEFVYGINSYQIKPADLRNQGRVKLDMEEFDPDLTYNIELDEIIERYVPLEISYASANDEEFFLKNKISDLNRRITITGPRSLLAHLQKVETEPVNEKMLKDGVIVTGLVLPDPRLRVIKSEITLEVTEAKQINKIISLIPINYPLDQNITIIPQKISVMILGPTEIVESVERSSINAFISRDKIKDIKDGESIFVSVDFEVPAGVKLVEYTPQQIQVIKNDKDTGF